MPLSIHTAIGWLLVIVTLGMVGYWVPAADKTIGESYLIFFFHFPSAVNCLNFFLIAGVASLLYLIRGGRNPRLDFWAASAVEVGLLACTITLVTGSLWARAAWNMWWNFKDPRLMTVAITWFTYVGYIAFRSSIEDPFKRARFCAVFGLIAAVNVPIVLFAIRVLGSESHPMAISLAEPSMVWTRWFGAAAFFVLYWALWRLRFRVFRSRDELASLEEEFHRAGI